MKMKSITRNRHSHTRRRRLLERLERRDLLALDIFLEIDGIEGGATRPNYEDQIVVGGFSWGFTSNGGTSDSSVRQTDTDDFSLSVLPNKASPILMRDAVLGQRRGTAQLSVVDVFDGEQVEIASIDLHNSIVTDFALSEESGQFESTLDTGFIGMGYSKIEMDFDQYDSKQRNVTYHGRELGSID